VVASLSLPQFENAKPLANRSSTRGSLPRAL
jgi:hypothetical protein